MMRTKVILFTFFHWMKRPTQKCYFKEPVHWDHPNIPLTAFLIIFRFYYVINGTKIYSEKRVVCDDA